jgi:16S rRNA (guanine(966)-N(2))-methyltransferase RsmD
MRIIAGKYKSRKIYTPPGDLDITVRPTSDRARETIFDMLSNIIDFDGIVVLDLFAGTGSFGFESLSRGADFVYFVDSSNENKAIINKTAVSLNCIDDIEYIRSDAFNFLKLTGKSFDVIFADPPYSFKAREDLIKRVLALNFQVFILEYDRGTEIKNDFINNEDYDIKDKEIGRSTFKFIIKKD